MEEDEEEAEEEEEEDEGEEEEEEEDETKSARWEERKLDKEGGGERGRRILWIFILQRNDDKLHLHKSLSSNQTLIHTHTHTSLI